MSGEIPPNLQRHHLPEWGLLPKVFIAYAHSPVPYVQIRPPDISDVIQGMSAETVHERWEEEVTTRMLREDKAVEGNKSLVYHLAKFLQKSNIAVAYDQLLTDVGTSNLMKWSQQQIEDSDFVILIITPSFCHFLSNQVPPEKEYLFAGHYLYNLIHNPPPNKPLLPVFLNQVKDIQLLPKALEATTCYEIWEPFDVHRVPRNDDLESLYALLTRQNRYEQPKPLPGGPVKLPPPRRQRISPYLLETQEDPVQQPSTVLTSSPVTTEDSCLLKTRPKPARLQEEETPKDQPMKASVLTKDEMRGEEETSDEEVVPQMGPTLFVEETQLEEAKESISTTEYGIASEEQPSPPSEESPATRKFPKTEERAHSEAIQEKEKEIQEMKIQLEDAWYKFAITDSKLSQIGSEKAYLEETIEDLHDQIEDLQDQIGVLNERDRYQQEQLAELKRQRPGIYSTPWISAAVPHSSHTPQQGHFSTAGLVYPHSGTGSEPVLSSTHEPALIARDVDEVQPHALISRDIGEVHTSTPKAGLRRSISPEPCRPISTFPSTMSRFRPLLPSRESGHHPVREMSSVPVLRTDMSYLKKPKHPFCGTTFHPIPPWPPASAYLPPVTSQAGTVSVASDPPLKRVQAEQFLPVNLSYTRRPDKVDNVQPKQSSTKPSPPAGTVSTFDYIRGVDVIAETRFVLTKGAQSFEWEDYGFRLHAPKGSLPEGLDQCEVKVKVSLSGHFDLPEGSELVSAVYWVYSPHLFLEPLTVEIQHCAAITTPTQCAQLTFIRTKCTQKELPYSFKELDGGSFKPNTPYGSIPVTHFSGIGVAKISIKRSSNRKGVLHGRPGTQDLSQTSSSSSRATSEKDDIDVQVQYCGQLYIFKRVNDWRLHFVVTKDLQVCLKVVGEHYSTFTSEDLSLSIGFESDKISLDVPEDGAQLKDDWKIYPRYDPAVKKSDVDLFTSGKRIPKCEMILEWENESIPPKRLRYKVGLQGARDHKFFLLVVDPDDEPSNEAATKPLKAGLPTQSSSIEHSWLRNEPELRHFQNLVACKIPGKWQEVGIQLRLEEGELRAIAKSAGGDWMHCFTSVFAAWRNRQTRDFSWETVVSVLRSTALGEIRLADEVSNSLGCLES